MRTAAIIGVALFSGCATEDPHKPTPMDIQVRIVSESKKLNLAGRAENEGFPARVDIDVSANPPLCRKHNDTLDVIKFPETGREKGYAEVGYYCKREEIFWYRKIGLIDRKERYLGPYRVRFWRPSRLLEDEEGKPVEIFQEREIPPP